MKYLKIIADEGREDVVKRAVNALGSIAVYKGRIKTDFVADVTDLMSLINDSDKHDS